MTRRLESVVLPEERSDVAAILEESGALDAARAEAENLVDEALEIVEKLKSAAERQGRSVENGAFESLAALARFVVRRDK